MKGAQERHESEVNRLHDEAKAAEDSANAKLKKTLDDHADEMRKFRQEQKMKDAEFRETIDKMHKEHEQRLRDQ